MKTLGNILWHFPFFGFVSAIVVYLIGTLLTVTVIAAPIGLGLMEFGKFLFSPFGHTMISKSDLNVEQNVAWKASVFAHQNPTDWPTAVRDSGASSTMARLQRSHPKKRPHPKAHCRSFRSSAHNTRVTARAWVSPHREVAVPAECRRATQWLTGPTIHAVGLPGSGHS